MAYYSKAKMEEWEQSNLWFYNYFEMCLPYHALNSLEVCLRISPRVATKYYF